MNDWWTAWGHELHAALHAITLAFVVWGAGYVALVERRSRREDVGTDLLPEKGEKLPRAGGRHRSRGGLPEDEESFHDFLERTADRPLDATREQEVREEP